MKRLLVSSLFFLFAIAQYGQTITLTFLGQDATTHNNLPLDGVYILNTTLGCDTVIYGEIPSIVLNYSLGIDDPILSGSKQLNVLPPVPNPFAGSTLVQIALSQQERLNINLVNSKGIVISKYNGDFSAGLHRFEIKSSTNEMLLLKVSNGSILRTVKLICIGNGIGENKIIYLGDADKRIKNAYAGGFKFQLGNQLLFKSIKTGYDESIITDSPTQNSNYNFQLTHSVVLPSVTTYSVSDPTQTTATCGGDVISDGGASVTAKGVCWSTSPNPTTSNSHTTDGIGTGSYISILTNLTASTLYFVRAYAINSLGTAYGNEESFSTLDPCNGETTITYENQIYGIISIGDQCWMKENLNYQVGNSWCPEDNPSYCNIYGRLYDWETVMNGESSSNSIPSGVQGICPSGWHIPSGGELDIIINYLGGSSVAGGKMKEAGYAHWNIPNTGATNESGFTALPAGRHIPGITSGPGNGAFFWSCSESDADHVFYLSLLYDVAGAGKFIKTKDYGFSLRCLKD